MIIYLDQYKSMAAVLESKLSNEIKPDISTLHIEYYALVKTKYDIGKELETIAVYSDLETAIKQLTNCYLKNKYWHYDYHITVHKSLDFSKNEVSESFASKEDPSIEFQKGLNYGINRLEMKPERDKDSGRLYQIGELPLYSFHFEEGFRRDVGTFIKKFDKFIKPLMKVILRSSDWEFSVV